MTSVQQIISVELTICLHEGDVDVDEFMDFMDYVMSAYNGREPFYLVNQQIPMAVVESE